MLEWQGASRIPYSLQMYLMYPLLHHLLNTLNITSAHTYFIYLHNRCFMALMCSVKKIINKHLPYEPVLIICIMIIQPEEARLCCGTNDPNVSMAYSYKDLLLSPTTCPLQGNWSCGPCRLFLKPQADRSNLFLEHCESYSSGKREIENHKLDFEVFAWKEHTSLLPTIYWPEQDTWPRLTYMSKEVGSLLWKLTVDILEQ